MFRIFWASVSASLLFTSSSPARAESEFRMRLVADPQTFDWNLATTTMETYLLMNIMEGLVRFDDGLKIKPQLASSWSISSDLRTYTFKLRPDVVWSDGKPLKAEDFVASWRRLLDPLLAAPYAYLIFDIEGAEDFNKRRTSDFSKVAIKAIDDRTIQVRLRKPVTYFLQMFTFWVTFPVRQDVIDKHGVEWTKPGNMVVLGPFIPASYRQGSQITLKRNERYSGPRPAADTVALRIVNEDSTALDLFKTGQLDFVRPVNFLELGKLASSPSFRKQEYWRTCFLNINTTKYPFNLPKVRQALAMAVDRSKIGQALHLTVEPTDTYLPAALFPQGRDVGLKFDPVAAKKLFQETGVDAGTLPKVELVSYASDENTLLAQFLQDQLKKNLGISTEIQAPEYRMFRTQLDLLSGSLYYRCWGADYADPDSFFDVFLSYSGNNHTGWKNARYDGLVEKAASLPDGPERSKTYVEALDLLLRKEAVIVPLHMESLTYLLSPRISGFKINPLNYVFLRDIVFPK